MAVTVQNLRPAVLDPVHRVTVTGPFNYAETLKDIVVEPMFTPITQGLPVSIEIDGQAVDAVQIAASLFACLGEQADGKSEKRMGEIFAETMANYPAGTSISAKELFALQAAAAHNMPLPSNICKYTPSTDIKPACKNFLAGSLAQDRLFANFAFFARPNCMGIYFSTSAAFSKFKAWLDTQKQLILNMADQDFISLYNSFTTLTLAGLTEGIRLRSDIGQNTGDGCFARFLMSAIMEYTKIAPVQEYGLMPFRLQELVVPKNLVIVNIEQHAHATDKSIVDEWKIINNSLMTPCKIISTNQLQNLTATARAAGRWQNMGKAIGGLGTKPIRTASARFLDKQPSPVDIAKMLLAILKKMGNVAKSHNICRYVTHTYARPSRRHPDDIDKCGRGISQKFYPDIHLYVDVSGSITEANFQDGVQTCILIAKKLDVDLYVNTFADDVTTTTLLKCRGVSMSEVYRRFLNIPKTGGGTDYEPVWRYIQMSRKRREELSLMLTDFCFSPPNEVIDHPENLYYMPISGMDWKDMKEKAEDFCADMYSIAPYIRTRMLC